VPEAVAFYILHFTLHNDLAMTTSQDKSTLFEERLLRFAFAIITVTRSVSKTQENKIIADQLIRAATSVGANYAEANNVSSRQDFRNKTFIAKKETAESRYWLRSLQKANPDIDVASHIDEASQVLMILQKVMSTLKNGK
jgi:four helix bundle protein